MVVVPIAFARELFGEGQNVSAIEINVNKGIDVENLKLEIAQTLDKNFVVKNRVQQNQALYNVLGSEKWMVYIILTFILIIAIFNIIGSLTMLVIEKFKDIAILNSLGASKKLIKQIFLAEGMMITLGGCIFGLLIGYVFCLLQQQFGWIEMGEGNFMVSAYPISFKWKDFVLVFATVTFFSFIASALAANLSVKRINYLSQSL
jgi:lipoprotein-releasing system permease protein